jgi:3-mercaptopyruvate sulfurtransferase SseA
MVRDNFFSEQMICQKRQGGCMRWKQFFTPVKSLDVPETRKFMDGLSGADYNLVDVRQPGEYRNSHIPGARLIPLADLSERLEEIDPGKPTVLY